MNSYKHKDGVTRRAWLCPIFHRKRHRPKTNRPPTVAHPAKEARMTNSRRTFLAIMAIALAGSVALVAFRGGPNGTIDFGSLVNGHPVEVTVASSTTKQKWMEAAVQAFA